jgi:hypothetical protein
LFSEGLPEAGNVGFGGIPGRLKWWFWRFLVWKVQGSGDSRFGGFRVWRVQGLESSRLG